MQILLPCEIMVSLLTKREKVVHIAAHYTRKIDGILMLGWMGIGCPFFLGDTYRSGFLPSYPKASTLDLRLKHY